MESRRCSQRMIEARVIPWQIRVAEADPAMPIFGKGPKPVINMGLRITSMEMAIRAKKKGVRESPVPLCAICTKEKKYMMGIAMKMTRR